MDMARVFSQWSAMYAQKAAAADTMIARQTVLRVRRRARVAPVRLDAAKTGAAEACILYHFLTR